MKVVENMWWGTQFMDTEIGKIPLVSTQLDLKDRIGHLKVRLGVHRMKYTVPPGLYGVGHPDSASPVMVSANYKMSFDKLRMELGGLDAWILVLDTKGINVWCAAGKGTFGTDELVKRIEETRLGRVVSHKKLILPQLGAPGVAGYTVTKKTGFKILYGPVLAQDIQTYIQNGYHATPQMRSVRFPLKERLVLTPLEILGGAKPLVIVLALLYVADLLGADLFSFRGFWPYVGAMLVGSTLTPILLPWIPGRAFAFKGWLAGMIFALGISILYGYLLSPVSDWKQVVVYCLVLPAISSFTAMGFTGCSTYTSLSGVVREMKFAVPFIFITGFSGVAFLIVKTFISF